MKITDVLFYRVSGAYAGPEYEPGDRQAQALDRYPEFNARPAPTPPKRGQRLQAIYLEIQTDEGVSGIYGPIDETQAFLAHRSLRPYLLNRDPLATELLFDQMLRMDRHGRSGMFMMAISVIDCALWDLKGKAWNQPIYRLLGGPTRPNVPAYASMLGYSTQPEAAAAKAAETKALGYTAQKWFFRFGPGDGEAGKRRNLDMARAVREAVGDDYTLMFDAFMGWDLPYATDMVRKLAPLNPFWMEEPVPPERVGTFVKIRAASSVPVATGEHIYTRWQAKELLVREAVDLLQSDPDWTGGISELVKVCAVASAFDVPVGAHGHSLLPALHVAGSQSPATVPFVEYLIRNQETKQAFWKHMYRPEQGEVALPSLPGLGIVLDEAQIEKREPLF
jgi:L-rhamnonate dehydratase